VEVDATVARRQASLARFACLPSPWRIADFDFDAQPSVDRKLVEDLASLRFLEDATNVLLIGPGVGKTMLAVGSAGPAWRRLPGALHDGGRPGGPLPQGGTGGRWASVMRFYAGPRLLVIDEVGYQPLAGRRGGPVPVITSAT